jgi:hypothetical protein
MSLRIVEAGEEHEPAALALHAALQSPPRVAAWERAFAPAAPEPARPLLCMEEGGEALAFVYTRSTSIQGTAEESPALVACDYLAVPGLPGTAAHRAMGAHLAAAAPAVLACGWGLEGVARLRAWNWQLLARWPRLVLDPPGGWLRGRRPPPPEGPIDWTRWRDEDANHSLRRDGACFLVRAEGYSRHLHTATGAEVFAVGAASMLAVRVHPGVRGSELHLVDGRVAQADVPAAAGFLAALVAARRHPLYASFHHPALRRALLDSGAREQRPRWGLFVCFGDRSIPLDLADSRGKWCLFPADFDLDV